MDLTVAQEQTLESMTAEQLRALVRELLEREERVLMNGALTALATKARYRAWGSDA